MAAVEIPLFMAAPMASNRDDSSSSANARSNNGDSPYAAGGAATFAAFSPVTVSANTPSRSSRRSTVLVHQKSPLLLATPPQITRALAYSHPFLLPLNNFVGLLTWSSGDQWQSFLLVCAFWLAVLYGDVIIIRTGPVAVGIGLIIAMYGRRYSPLSSKGWSGATGAGKPKLKKQSTSTTTAAMTDANGQVDDDAKSAVGGGGGGASGGGPASKHQRNKSEITSTKHQKTLDEIVETLKEFTSRCNTLMEPLLDMTDFLSTQQTPTSATTRPALIAMFMRLLIVTPFWYALTFSPWRVITTKRVILVLGTIVLTWHSRVMRVTRTLLWRSSAVRRTAGIVTGLTFDAPIKNSAALQLNRRGRASAAAGSKVERGHNRSASIKSVRSSGVKFTFIIYENQRRWVGLGWTHSLFAYERSAWTDEHSNAVPAREDFELPHVEDGSKMQWQWAEGSRWRVDGVPDEHSTVDYDGDAAKNGWIYYDNKWQYGRRGQDGWGKWTRRRKWYRDAELVEVDGDEAASIKSKAYSTGNDSVNVPEIIANGSLPEDEATSIKTTTDDNASTHSAASRSFWPTLRRRTTDRSAQSKEKDSKRPSDMMSDAASIMTMDEDDAGPSLGIEAEMEMQKQGRWGIGDEARMGLE